MKIVGASQSNALFAFTAVLAVLGSLCITVLFAFYQINDYTLHRERRLQELKDDAELAAGRFQDIVNNINITVELLDEWIQQHPREDPRTSANFTRYVDIFREFSGNIVDIRLVTGNGDLFYIPAEGSAPLTNIQDREYFTAHLNQPFLKPYFGLAILGRVNNRWALPIAYRLHRNNYGYSMLMASIDLEGFEPIFRDSLTRSDYAGGVLRDRKQIVIRYPFEEKTVGQVVDFGFMENGFEVSRVDIPETRERIAYISEIQGTDVSVYIAGDYQDLVNAQRKVVAVRLVLVMLLLGAYILLNMQAIRMTLRNRKISADLERAARFDALTSLMNRRYFFERVTEDLARLGRGHGKAAMLSIDIDHFKRVNDSWGHPEGDRVLKEVAAVLARTTRVSDHAGRVGGEEFAIFLPDTDRLTALDIARRLRTGITRVELPEGHVTASIGLAPWRGVEEGVPELYKRADDALYRAKNNGRDRIEAD
jgi:diguanylate cyclase (GGDEF)-like protein